MRVDERRELRRYENYRAYAKSGAMCFEIDNLPSKDEANTLQTITIEGAVPAQMRDPLHRNYDWANKIIFQLTRRELPTFVGALLGWIPNWTATGHGSDHSKSINLVHQKNSIKFMLREGGKSIVMPVAADDIYMIVVLCVKALQMNDPHLTSDSVLSLCRSVSMMKG